jgi:hypothetical protein
MQCPSRVGYIFNNRWTDRANLWGVTSYGVMHYWVTRNLAAEHQPDSRFAANVIGGVAAVVRGLPYPLPLPFLPQSRLHKRRFVNCSSPTKAILLATNALSPSRVKGDNPETRRFWNGTRARLPLSSYGSSRFRLPGGPYYSHKLRL